jgi:hypothetical protein
MVIHCQEAKTNNNHTRTKQEIKERSLFFPDSN